jgi:hypothetical protein
MTRDLRKVIGRGVCTFGATINRNRDGYGSIQAADPSEACLELCDYCWHMANHIMQGIEDAEAGKQQSVESFDRTNRKA